MTNGRRQGATTSEGGVGRQEMLYKVECSKTTTMYHMHTFIVSKCMQLVHHYKCMHMIHSDGFRFSGGFGYIYLIDFWMAGVVIMSGALVCKFYLCVCIVLVLH